MKKVFFVVLLIVALVAVLGSAAAWRGAAPVVGDCSGSLPQGGYVVYRAQSTDGNCLQGYVWQPEGGVRAVVVVVHGLHDHARRYEALARGLSAGGVAVVAQDQRGHGGSGGAPQRLDSVDQLLGDLELARAQAATRFPNVPQILYGHSLGGMVAAQHVARNGAVWRGVVLSSAALKLPIGLTSGKARVVSAVSAVAPNLGLDAIDEALLVREPAQRKAMVDDTVLRREKLPARTVATLLTGVMDLQARIPQITTPMLLLHGKQDLVTDPEGSKLVQEGAGSPEKQLVLFDHALHDLLHEPEASEVIQAVSRFIQSRLQ